MCYKMLLFDPGLDSCLAELLVCLAAAELHFLSRTSIFVKERQICSFLYFSLNLMHSFHKKLPRPQQQEALSSMSSSVL